VLTTDAEREITFPVELNGMADDQPLENTQFRKVYIARTDADGLSRVTIGSLLVVFGVLIHI